MELWDLKDLFLSIGGAFHFEMGGDVDRCVDTVFYERGTPLSHTLPSTFLVTGKSLKANPKPNC